MLSYLVHFLLFSSSILTTTVSAYRRNDRHSDPPHQHDSPNPPSFPDYSSKPSVMPSNPPSKKVSLAPSISQLPSITPSEAPSLSLSPSKKISEFPSLPPSKAPSSSPSLSSKPSPLGECKSDANGSFGDTTSEGNTQVDVPHKYKMEVNDDYNEDQLNVLKREMTNVVVGALYPDCATINESADSATDPSAASIVGISAGNDAPVDECDVQNDESTHCHMMEGGISIYIDVSRRLLTDTLTDVASPALLVQDVIKSSMDSGELLNTVTGITSLSWVPLEDQNITDRNDRIDINEEVNQDDVLLYAIPLIGGLSLLIGGYAVIKHKERLKSKSSGSSESDGNFEELA